MIGDGGGVLSHLVRIALSYAKARHSIGVCPSVCLSHARTDLNLITGRSRGFLIGKPYRDSSF